MGRLTLCCNLSGYRGATGHNDIVADLNKESFANVYNKLQELAASQFQKRRSHLAQLTPEQAESDFYSASPCMYCLKSFGKMPWLETMNGAPVDRRLPVVS
jgi:hypothetical protein